MRGILGLLIGLYLTCALVVLGGGAYGFLTHQNTPHEGCAPAALPGQTGAGGTNWIPFTLMRAAIWPKAYYDDMKRTSGVIDWLVVRYDAFPSGCS
jgi:hypothetical protein